MYQQRRPPRQQPRHRARRPARRRRRSSCLWNAVVLGVLALLLFEGYVHLARPSLSSFLGEQVAVRLGLPADSAGTGQPGGGALEEQIVGQARQSLPTAIAALPSGELRVTDAQANAFLAANQEALDPIEGVQVQFVPGQVRANVRMFGTVSQMTAGLAVQDGQARLLNPQLDGPLGTLVSIEEIVRPLEREINSLLLSQGQRLQSGRIEQGEVIVYIEQG
jgi:hypothetical protein